MEGSQRSAANISRAATKHSLISACEWNETIETMRKYTCSGEEKGREWGGEEREREWGIVGKKGRECGG